MRQTVAYIILLVLISFNSYSQKLNDRIKEYSYANSIDLKADSLPNYIVSLKKKIEIAKSNNNKLAVADNNLFLSILYIRLKSYDIAIDYNIIAQKIYEDLKDTSFLVKSYRNMGTIYTYSGNNKISLEYNYKNLHLAELRQDSVLLRDCYINLFANYISLGNDSTGIKFYKKALQVSKEIGSKKYIAYLYSNFGSLNYNKNNYDTALFYYNKSLQIVKGNDKYKITAGLYSNIAQTLLKQKKYEEALKNVEISIKLYETKDMLTDADDAYKIAIKSLSALNRSEKIPKYLAAYDSVMKKIVNVRKVEYATKLKVLYDINEYETTINKLDIENKLKSSKLLYISIFLILAFLIIVFIFFQNLKLKKSYKIIVKDNIKVLKVEDENKKLKELIPDKPKVSKDDETQDYDINLYNDIVNIIEKEKLFLNPNFNLRKLSELLEINRSYISKSINKISKKSFVEFINEYRVNEAKRMLTNNEANNYTIEAIGEKSGFNSYSTFTRVFKTTVGTTPSFFMNNVNI